MRTVILFSLLFTQVTFGAVASYRAWVVSWNWNPVTLLGLNSMVIQKQTGDFSQEVVDALVAPVRTSDLRMQRQAVEHAIGNAKSYSQSRTTGGQVCVMKTVLPETADGISDAYLVAGTPSLSRLTFPG